MALVRCAAGAIALAGCYGSAGEAPCSVACDFGGAAACPGKLECQPDNLCHAANEACLDPYALAVLADHPIAYWRLDEAPGDTTAHDLMHLVDGKYSGNCGFGAPGALSVDAAVRFDGSTCWVTIDDVPQLRFPDHNPFTVEAWVSPEASFGMYQHVFTRESRSAGPIDGYALLVIGSQIGQAERVVGSANAFAEENIAQTFQHLAEVYDGADLYVYVDGVGQSVAAPLSMTIFAMPEFIGASGPSSNQFLGVLDEIAVYDHALTQAQLQGHIAARD